MLNKVTQGKARQTMSWPTAWLMNQTPLGFGRVLSFKVTLPDIRQI